jgi:site-specific recombinase XerD
MVEQYVRRPCVVARLRASPFASELDALAVYLGARGYRPGAIVRYLSAAAHLADCIAKKFVSLDGLTADALQRFARRHATCCKCRCAHRASKNFVSVARHFFQVLRDQGRCSVPTTVPRSPSPIEILLEELDQHLREARGLTSSTRERHLRDLRPLLEGKYGGNAVDPAAITVAEVRRWVAARAASTSPRTARQTATAIRSLVRFFVFQGRSAGHLVTAVPMVQAHRLSAMPRALSDEQLAQLMGSIDVSKPIGLRTRAIVECAGSLGLRAGEIAALRISDVDWREGAVRLPRTKSRRAQALPLLRGVGQALVAYLKSGRPESPTDRIFVRHYFPVGGPLQSTDVTNTVRRAMRRAGLRLPSIGAHALRHTIASRLVRAGVGMKDIADVMRHRDIDTTRIYAKVDWPRLAEVALPWPATRMP